MLYSKTKYIHHRYIIKYQKLVIEQRRTNKLLVELIDEQKNNHPLHGLEYELVEEEEIIEDQEPAAS
ncbi:MAG: hypothetical protein GY750_08355 [Lentisphaerae bacterium]|nr:hypothetical protein [Lentisphaerota bacterium]MCP4101421.1 hypothetical protein [Lentisphaerota bacterium]